MRPRLTGRRGKPEFELETWRVIKHFDPRAMKTGDGRDQAEPETVSGRVAALFEPVKALEHMLVFVGGNSGPVIGDRDHRLAIDVFVRDDDLPSGAAMLDRIVHEVGYGIEDQIAIAGHQHLAIADNAETGAVRFSRGIVQLDNLAGDFDQIHGAEPAFSGLGLDLRNPHDRREYPQHGIEVGDRVADQRLIILSHAPTVIGLLQPSAHSRQRRPQVVRDIVADLLDLPHQGFDAVQHQVEVLRNAIPFVVGAAERNTLVETALHDGPAGGVDLLDPPHRPPRYQDAGDPRDHEYQCNARDH